MEMVYFVVTDHDWSKNFQNIGDAKKLMESWKDSYMGEGVSEDSFIELREADTSYEPDIDNARILQRFEVVEDEQQLKDFGTPEENGMDFAWWAKWQEVNV